MRCIDCKALTARANGARCADCHRDWLYCHGVDAAPADRPAVEQNRPALAPSEVPAPQPAQAEAGAMAGQPGALAHGGAKADSGKLGTHLLPTRPLEEIARVLDFGARKYAPDNWRKGIAYTRVYGAILRHAWAWWRGEQADPETGLHPLAHAACEILFLLDYELGPAPRREAFDDRPEKG